MSNGYSRRGFLTRAAAAPGALYFQRAGSAAGDSELPGVPDVATMYTEAGPLALTGSGGKLQAAGVAVELRAGAGATTEVHIEAPRTPLVRLQLRWRIAAPAGARVLGDEWERGYGEMEWRGLAADRILPWYFLLSAGRVTHGYGVATGAAAFAFWQVDAEGISLWLDLRNGGSAVQLGERRLHAASIVTRRGEVGESVFDAARMFCRRLCAKPILPAAPVYGGNNWYYTYGRNCSAEGILRDSENMASLSPGGANRPYMVIDDGWQPTNVVGPWDRGNARFPDMPELARQMVKKGVRPGIWVRPLGTRDKVPDNWAIRRKGPSANFATLDPSIPEVLARVREDVGRLAGWGYELIKHDYSSFDVMGRWGFAMKAGLTDDGWSFADRSRTTAEIVIDFYRAVRGAAGKSVLIGCNTFGHLAAGLVEMQRIGDDTSGRDWNRTRRMGVNSLAFRMPQHETFFANDGDCVGLTRQVSWEMNKQWLDLLARSGTPLFVSADPEVLGAAQRTAIQAAFARAARPQPAGEPLDWMDTTLPTRWRFGRETVAYRWSGESGPSPFAG
jgi:alpha-galactosidase